MAAETQPFQLLVGEVLHHVEQARVGAEEVLAHVGAVFDGVLLVLAIDDLPHPLREEPVVVGREQRIPVAAPDRLDDVPAGAAEDGLELLDDLPVAAHGAIEPLQVAVDDEDQVVELFTRREADGAERFGLVGFTVAEIRPDFRIRGLLQATIFQIAHEPRLIDRHDRAEAHGDCRVFPEVWHQPRVRVRRQPAPLRELAAEVVQLLDGDAPFQERARVNPGRGVPLEVHDVAPPLAPLAAEEMIEADFVQSRRGRVRGDVSANAVRQAIGAYHHGHGIPAHEALDAALDFLAARQRRLFFRANGVDVRSDRAERQTDALHARVMPQRREKALDAAAISLLYDVIERFAPLALFEGLELGVVLRCDVSHLIESSRVRPTILYCSPGLVRRLARP